MSDDPEDTGRPPEQGAEESSLEPGPETYEDEARLGRPSGEPDVLLDVPKLGVEEISLEVEDLRARVSLQAEVLDLLKLNVGADVALGRVHLDIKGVDAQALLKVRLDNVADIVNRVLTTIDRNPQILEQLTSGVASAAQELGGGARQAVGELGSAAGDAVQDVGGSAGKAVEDVSETAEEVGGTAGGVAEDVGGATREAAGAAEDTAEKTAQGASASADGARRSGRERSGEAPSDSDSPAARRRPPRKRGRDRPP